MKADPSDETVINGVPYDADKAIRSRAERPAIPVYVPNAHIVNEIKRRQILLAMRYVAAVRARS
jgi:hypothetical protein